jgi:hypothetical protein
VRAWRGVELDAHLSEHRRLLPADGRQALIDRAAQWIASVGWYGARPRRQIAPVGAEDEDGIAGRDVGQARDEAVALGISINGLVILSETPLPWNPEHTNPPGGLTKYYRDNVIGGPGSFALEAKDFNSFGEAIIKKMIAEIAALQ